VIVDERLLVGRITSVHGIRGECVVEVLSDAPERFEGGATLGAGAPGAEPSRTLTVAGSRPHKSRLLVRFSEITDRTQAETLRGVHLTIAAAEAAPLPDGMFYPHEIQGFGVVDEDGAPLGTLHEILESPAHDVWVIRTPDGKSVMVPAVEEFVRAVEPEARRIVIAPIGGMFD
jgi:16S rRNA processing protein RimM